MPNDKRDFLIPNDIIYLDNRKFQIIDVKGKGSSTICYYAKNIDTNEKGYLREFYPTSNSIIIERDCSTKCIFSEDKEYKRQREKYKRPYQIISEKRNGQNAILNNYLPHIELIETSLGALYTWTPEPVHAVNFDKYIEKVIADPINNCEEKLINILDVICSVSKCIQAIHEAGLIFLDMKPENLSVAIDRNDNNDYKLNTQNITVFDLNSVQEQSYDDHYNNVLVSPKYCAPELLGSGTANVTSDIYSIGAMLYYAICIKRESDSYSSMSYSINDYRKINNILKKSELIKHSSINVSTIARLGEILKKSLAFNPKNRYQSCEEMTKDLESVTSFFSDKIRCMTKEPLFDVFYIELENKFSDIRDQFEDRKDMQEYIDTIYEKNHESIKKDEHTLWEIEKALWLSIKDFKNSGQEVENLDKILFFTNDLGRYYEDFDYKKSEYYYMISSITSRLLVDNNPSVLNINNKGSVLTNISKVYREDHLLKKAKESSMEAIELYKKYLDIYKSKDLMLGFIEGYLKYSEALLYEENFIGSENSIKECLSYIKKFKFKGLYSSPDVISQRAALINNLARSQELLKNYKSAKANYIAAFYLADSVHNESYSTIFKSNIEHISRIIEANS